MTEEEAIEVLLRIRRVAILAFYFVLFVTAVRNGGLS